MSRAIYPGSLFEPVKNIAFVWRYCWSGLLGRTGGAGKISFDLHEAFPESVAGLTLVQIGYFRNRK
jgi:hypothetical protein